MNIRQSKNYSVPAPEQTSMCAIVVLFYPDDGFSGRLLRLCEQFQLIILVDNTPNGASLLSLPDHVQIVRNKTNCGVATALNQGLKLAQSEGCSWAVTLDQDSELAGGYLQTLLAVAAQHVPCPVLVGTNYIDAHTGYPAHHFRSKENAVERLTLITSGTMLPIEFSVDIGGFRDDYFIDSVDHEFCLRARRHGAQVLITTHPFMTHCIGTSASGRRLRLASGHPPMRKYYIARNTLVTARAHVLRHPLWALRQMARLMGEAVSILVLESERRPKLRAFSHGLWDGITGRRVTHE